jgi:predicted nucleotide-binding protein (sugar kinase/HSP70/actin superfamily)
VSHLVPARLVGGDAVLTVGAALAEIIDEVSGVIAIGPFGCLPSRIAEAILTHTLNDEKCNVTDDVRMAGKVMAEHPSLPFLAIESDGNVFPQVIQARLEAFCLQVARVHRTIREAKGKG